MNQAAEAVSPSNEYSRVVWVVGEPNGCAQQFLGKH
jgi:hypothetical protein